MYVALVYYVWCSYASGEYLSFVCVCPCSPLQAFLEDPQGGKSGPPHPPQRRPNLPLSLPQTTALEERIKEELTLLGLFEPVEVGGASCIGVLLLIILAPPLFCLSPSPTLPFSQAAQGGGRGR